MSEHDEDSDERVVSSVDAEGSAEPEIPSADGEGSEALVDGPGGTGRAASSRWLTLGRLLLAPVLAAGAVGVHWWLNVPEHIVESPRDQGSKKKKPKPKRASNRARPARRDRSARNESRTPAQLDRDWVRYSITPFEEEPTRAGWARQHQALINRAVIMARRDAFEGAPERPRVVQADTHCRTVRCRFTLRSPYRHELEVISGALARMEAGGEPLWRSYAVTEVPDPSGEGAVEGAGAADDGTGEHALEVTVAFVIDAPDSSALEIPEVAEDEGTEKEPAPASTVATNARHRAARP